MVAITVSVAVICVVYPLVAYPVAVMFTTNIVDFDVHNMNLDLNLDLDLDLDLMFLVSVSESEAGTESERTF